MTNQLKTNRLCLKNIDKMFINIERQRSAGQLYHKKLEERKKGDMRYRQKGMSRQSTIQSKQHQQLDGVERWQDQNMFVIARNQQKHNTFVSVMLLEQNDRMLAQIQDVKKQIQKQEMYALYLQDKRQEQSRQLNRLKVELKSKQDSHNRNHYDTKTKDNYTISKDKGILISTQRQRQRQRQIQGYKGKGIHILHYPKSKAQDMGYNDMIRHDIQTKQKLLNKKLSSLQLKRSFKNNPQQLQKQPTYQYR